MERETLLYELRRKLQVGASNIISPILLSKAYYRLVMKKKLDLNNPKTFNEKIQWLKLNYFPSNELVVKCTDKYLVRDYVKECGYENKLVNLIGVYENVDQIDWNLLPNQFVLKCNHGCAYNIVCTDKKKIDKSNITKKLTKWLNEDFGKFNMELHYSKIKKHLIICEEFLGEKLIDYKFFCFNGTPKFMYVSRDLIHDRQAEIGFFELNGKKIDLVRDDYDDFILDQLPSFYSEMLEMAKKLSSQFPFVRVDFFVTKNNYYFAELTFTPSAGMMPIRPESFDRLWGEYIELDQIKG